MACVAGARNGKPEGKLKSGMCVTQYRTAVARISHVANFPLSLPLSSACHAGYCPIKKQPQVLSSYGETRGTRVIKGYQAINVRPCENCYMLAFWVRLYFRATWYVVLNYLILCCVSSVSWHVSSSMLGENRWPFSWRVFKIRSRKLLERKTPRILAS